MSKLPEGVTMNRDSWFVDRKLSKREIDRVQKIWEGKYCYPKPRVSYSFEKIEGIWHTDFRVYVGSSLAEKIVWDRRLSYEDCIKMDAYFCESYEITPTFWHRVRRFFLRFGV